MEIGLLNIIKRRYLTPEIKYGNINKMEPIRMDQVFLINIIMCCGIITALVAFVIEKIIYVCKLKLL